jgi:hypothetical protein
MGDVMTSKTLNRRQMLRGAGGFTLGLPFLASLARPRFAHGADPVPAQLPRFVAFTTEHGGIAGASMYPDAALLTQKSDIFAGHSAAYGPLRARVEGADAVVSAVLRAPTSVLTDRLVGKMNVLRGLDIPFYIAHHTGGHLGNYARNDGNGSEGQSVQNDPWPTIDQVMAYSPSFYPDLGAIKERSLYMGTRDGMCWGWSSPTSHTGTIQQIRSEPSSLALFNRIFVPPATTTTPAVNPRKPIVDRVIENYRSLRNGSRRLSAADRQRLDDHLDRLNELQRRLTVSRPATASCGGVAKPTDDSDKVGYSYQDPAKSKRRFQLYNDVIAAAFMCGTTRIAVVSVGDTFSSFSGDWHQDVAHKYASAMPQQLLVDALRLTFQGAILDLAAKLDVDEAPGQTYLDNTLVQWSQESGQHTHDSPSIPVVTFGGAAGFLKTGLFVDYRNQTTKGKLTVFGESYEYTGLTYNRWLATALQAMRVGRAEFERPGVPGYANPFVAPAYKAAYVPGALAAAGEVAPLLRV